MADLVAKAEAAEHPAAPNEKVRTRRRDVTTLASVLAPWGPLHRLYCDDVYVARQIDLVAKMRDRLLLYYEMNASANALRAAFRWYASRSSEGCDWEQFQELCSDLDLETSLIKDKILPMFASIQQQSGAVLLSGFAEAVIRTACILHPDGLPSCSLTRFITERFLKRARKLGTDAFSRLVSAPLIKDQLKLHKRAISAVFERFAAGPAAEGGARVVLLQGFERLAHMLDRRFEGDSLAPLFMISNSSSAANTVVEEWQAASVEAAPSFRLSAHDFEEALVRLCFVHHKTTADPVASEASATDLAVWLSRLTPIAER